MKIKVFVLLWLFFLFNGCDKKEDMDVYTQSTYVDFGKFKEGRPCSDVKFLCLTESKDRSWQSKKLSDGLDVFELNSKVMEQFNKIVKQWNKDYDDYHTKSHPEGEKEPMFITQLDRNFFDKVKTKQFFIEMEEELEKEFPGFWKDVEKPVRYRWIRRAMNKSKKLGYGDGEITDNIQIIELCARIGLDFDLDTKWNEITEFITHKGRGERSYGEMAVKYIDFTVFNKNVNRHGNPINDWSLRIPLSYLPQPKRPIPKLND